MTHDLRGLLVNGAESAEIIPALRSSIPHGGAGMEMVASGHHIAEAINSASIRLVKMKTAEHLNTYVFNIVLSIPDF